MTIESILVLLVIGAIAGWLAGKFMKGGGLGLWVSEIWAPAGVAEVFALAVRSESVAATIATGTITASSTELPVVLAMSVCPETSSPGA